MSIPALLSANAWVTHLFTAKAVREGWVIRRKRRDIERYVGRHAFEQELGRRGYHTMKNAGQLIVYFNQEPVRVIL